MIRKTVLVLFLCCVIAVTAMAMHDEPGSYREFELKRERIEIEINITELFHQLTYVPVDARPVLYKEMQDLQQRWQEILRELVEIDRVEHPQPPVK